MDQNTILAAYLMQVADSFVSVWPEHPALFSLSSSVHGGRAKPSRERLPAPWWILQTAGLHENRSADSKVEPHTPSGSEIWYMFI